jgi:hypothetical protein
LSSSQVSPDIPATRRRPTLPAGLALTGGAITFTSLYLAAGALTPLLVAYKEQWKFPPRFSRWRSLSTRSASSPPSSHWGRSPTMSADARF